MEANNGLKMCALHANEYLIVKFNCYCSYVEIYHCIHSTEISYFYFENPLNVGGLDSFQLAVLKLGNFKISSVSTF